MTEASNGYMRCATYYGALLHCQDVLLPHTEWGMQLRKISEDAFKYLTREPGKDETDKLFFASVGQVQGCISKTLYGAQCSDVSSLDDIAAPPSFAQLFPEKLEQTGVIRNA